MKITVFAKKRQSKDGRTFYTYLSTLTKKDGGEIPCSVRFGKEIQAPKPELCPLNIIAEKSDCNLSKKKYFREETGEFFDSYTLWVNNYTLSEELFVDHSMDDIED